MPSCPKCGSAEVEAGKCLECGALVLPRRSSVHAPRASPPVKSAPKDDGPDTAAMSQLPVTEDGPSTARDGLPVASDGPTDPRALDGPPTDPKALTDGPSTRFDPPTDPKAEAPPADDGPPTAALTPRFESEGSKETKPKGVSTKPAPPPPRAAEKKPAPTFDGPPTTILPSDVGDKPAPHRAPPAERKPAPTFDGPPTAILASSDDETPAPAPPRRSSVRQPLPARAEKSEEPEGSEEPDATGEAEPVPGAAPSSGLKGGKVNPKAWRNPKWDRWYAAAGVERDSQRIVLGDSSLGQSFAIGQVPSRMTPPVVLLSVVALVQTAAAVLGMSLVSGLGAFVALVGAFMLWRGMVNGQFAAWLYSALGFIWGIVLAVKLRHPLQGARVALPAAAVFGTMHLVKPLWRWLCAGLGIALSLGLVGVVVQAKAHQAQQAAMAGISAIDGYYIDSKLGYSFAAPEGAGLVPSPSEARELLPPPFNETVSPRVGFVSDDGTMVGGIIATQQAPGTAMVNLLSNLTVGGASPVRNDKLVPDSLRNVAAEGWEIPSDSTPVWAVVCRAPDGRAFVIFAVVNPAARAPNQKLFHTIAWNLKVKKSLAPTPAPK